MARIDKVLTNPNDSSRFGFGYTAQRSWQVLPLGESTTIFVLDNPTEPMTPSMDKGTGGEVATAEEVAPTDAEKALAGQADVRKFVIKAVKTARPTSS